MGDLGGHPHPHHTVIQTPPAPKSPQHWGAGHPPGTHRSGCRVGGPLRTQTARAPQRENTPREGRKEVKTEKQTYFPPRKRASHLHVTHLHPGSTTYRPATLKCTSDKDY